MKTNLRGMFSRVTSLLSRAWFPLILLSSASMAQAIIWLELGTDAKESMSIALGSIVGKKPYAQDFRMGHGMIFQAEYFSTTVMRDPYNENRRNYSLELPINMLLFGLAFTEEKLAYAPVVANGKILYPIGRSSYLTFRNKIAPYVFQKHKWTRQELMAGYEVFWSIFAVNPYCEIQLDYTDNGIHPTVKSGFSVGFGFDQYPDSKGPQESKQ